MTHENFIRVSWEEARELMESALHDKYGAKGKIVMMKNYMKDYGYDGIGEHYDAPTFVDVYLREP